jgi:hypothetical protein
MKARKALEGASSHPATVKALCQAFDEAWASIAHLYSSDYNTERTIEQARLGLANSVLAVAPLYTNDLDALKHAAVQHFAMSYRGAETSSN